MKALQNFWRNPFTIRTTSAGINYTCNHETYFSPSLSEAEASELVSQYLILEYRARLAQDKNFCRRITRHMEELYRYDTTFLDAKSLDSLAAVILMYPGDLFIRYDFGQWRITAA